MRSKEAIWNDIEDVMKRIRMCEDYIKKQESELDLSLPFSDNCKKIDTAQSLSIAKIQYEEILEALKIECENMFENLNTI